MKKIIITLCVVLTSWSTFSQNSDRREKIKALKVAFITERLALTETEAQKFWPIYNTYENKKDEQRRMGYEKRKQISEDMTEAQAKAMLKDFVAFEKEREDLRSNFVESLLKVMPAKKIIQLKLAEEEFNRKMLQEYKKRHSKD
ncbi:sensor of ECF-type sigma factor [uncultured Gelidibacter sp.]|uniref:sensor of ECF-type sigma factor n=1 Tax=uncultured Gelidibacter sp. TaxID=259318 RepID=UPI0026035894|nr:sensor of ECF-type sigma factor [uncultured Gelidibacter sp.]